MRKRLHVLLPDKELAEIHQSARRQRMATAEWVRRALRAARRAEPRIAPRRKLDVVRVASGHAFPAPGNDPMPDEIERGYLAGASR